MASSGTHRPFTRLSMGLAITATKPRHPRPDRRCRFPKTPWALRHNRKARKAKRERSSCGRSSSLLPLSLLQLRAATGFPSGAFRWPVPAKVKSANQWGSASGIWRAQWINRIDQYVFPVVTLSAETEARRPSARSSKRLTAPAVKPQRGLELATAAFWSRTQAGASFGSRPTARSTP